MVLIDSQGRHLHKLRVQLTDACNMRCFYCMPETMRFLPNTELLNPSELIEIVGNLNLLGVDELRVTGGEPTLRPEFDAILSGFARMPWKKIGLTTNGLLLKPKLPLLWDLGIHSINISLDSLDETKFNAITRRSHFRQVLDSILEAKNRGFNLKLNCIVFRGINDDELPEFIRFSEKHEIEVRFLELMKVGPGYTSHPERFFSADEMLSQIEKTEKLYPLEVASDSTSFVFKNEKGARIGFIASETKPFCGTCSRLRLTAKGVLRACLFSEQGENLKGKHPDEYQALLKNVMGLKPKTRLHHIKQPMNQIGG